MLPATSRISLRSTLALVTLALALCAPALDAQAQGPRGRGAQAPARTPARPAPPAPAAQGPVEPARPPAPPPPQDVRFKTTYTAGDQKTENVTFVKGDRERFEFQDMVLLKQHDQKRVVQISRAAKTYLVMPAGMPSPTTAPDASPAAPPKPPGVVMVATTIVDTGERKTAFGQQARRVKTMIDKQPMAGACDTSKQRVETDGWYIDAPRALAARPTEAAPPVPAAGGCTDQINATHNGDPAALGFPIAYTTTMLGEDGKPSVASMEVSEFELTTLDPALFEIPPGMNAAMNVGELGRALSDANEARLAADNAGPSTAPVAKIPGVIRIGVPELTNKTTTTVDTRRLREDLIDNLVAAKFHVTPLAAAPQEDLQKLAAERGLDYLLLAEVTDLKVAKSGGIGGLMKAASKVTGGGAQKDPTEASIAVKLVQPDGKQRLSTTAKGKDGSTLQNSLGLARFAGGMYMTMFMGPMGPQMMSRLYRVSGLTGGNLGGLGMLGNPALFQMQSMSLGMGLRTGGGSGVGIDQTAGAASFLVQQTMAMNEASSAGAAGGPSYAESLAEALDNASKAVVKGLEKK